MTKEQYLILRKSGKKRMDIVKEFFGGDTVPFRSFLSMIGLLNLEKELIAIRDFDKTSESKAEKLEPIKQEKEKKPGKSLTFPHVNKEFIEAEFAAGKTAGQIEREAGMQQGVIYSRLKKWGIVNPNSTKPTAEKTVTLKQAEKQEVPENLKVIDKGIHEAYLKDDAPDKKTVVTEIAESLPTQFIYFQVPIIEGYKIVDRGMAGLFDAVFLEKSRGSNLVESAETLFTLMQRYTQLLHEQMETLIVEGNPAEHVQKFIQKHNMIHIDKESK